MKKTLITIFGVAVISTFIAAPSHSQTCAQLMAECEQRYNIVAIQHVTTGRACNDCTYNCSEAYHNCRDEKSTSRKAYKYMETCNNLCP